MPEIDAPMSAFRKVCFGSLRDALGFARQAQMTYLGSIADGRMTPRQKAISSDTSLALPSTKKKKTHSGYPAAAWVHPELSPSDNRVNLE